ncbi:hypothetical protein WS70_00850 [Burkholderia mayonis]|uniref:Uncharacterized protein n=1 Tax=Burkholderia mayonis TaxID=1385591 RepID=A0A1B4FA38_9BURK|nr:hypothetical protein WS70_00850 [Burkholderia mayonis]KVE34886.1 hypothetical protein WS69_15930 [Burkholderia sp. BDU5]KVE48809.1 hypothetical protein WS70_21215 [Burkholderia mayonis]
MRCAHGCGAQRRGFKLRVGRMVHDLFDEFAYAFSIVLALAGEQILSRCRTIGNSASNPIDARIFSHSSNSTTNSAVGAMCAHSAVKSFSGRLSKIAAFDAIT